MYCGNNARHPSLLDGSKVLGTRLGCLQNGITRGLSQPIDPAFLGDYEPIDTTKKYCGNKPVLPPGYDRNGGLYECYLKGVGTGKKLKAERSDSSEESSEESSGESSEESDYGFRPKSKKKYKYIWLLICFILFVLFIYCMYRLYTYFYEKDEDEDEDEGKNKKE